ncbi:MAG TPA: hypothetical protein VJ919_13210 [Tangfeifania sp.]|nr:hypothetical protein [Tangfeifania sp.]
MKRLIRLFTLFFSSAILLAIANSCGTSTMVTGTWQKPAVTETYDNIMVTALVPTTSSRSAIERSMVANLREEGTDASQSIDVIPPRLIEEEDKKREIQNTIIRDGFDGVLTITLIDEDTETRYVRGSGMYRPYPYYGFYGNFWGYYDYWYPRFYEPGYYVENKVYYMETNLYDAQTEDLVWSAQSETYDPIDLESFAEGFSEEIVEELDEQGLIP